MNNAYCVHCDEFEKLMLDDQNCSTTECLGCKQLYTPQKNISVDSSTYLDTSLEKQKVKMMLDSDYRDFENLEGSPLLVPSTKPFHCHDVITSHDDNKAWNKLLAACILCFLFVVAEFIGGYFAGSLAIMTDAAHLFSDFISFLISLLSICIARWPVSKTMTFGYHRAEVLGALLSILSIWLLAIIFAILAIIRIFKQDYEIQPDTMLIVASLGLLINLGMGGLLFGFCHNHSHGASSMSPDSNINVKAAAAHVMGDLIQGLGVLLAAAIIKCYPNAKAVDPVCTLLFSIIVFFTTAKVAKDSMRLLLEGSPKDTSELSYQLIKCIPNIKHIHNLHLWSLAPGKDVMSMHLCVDIYCDRELILKEATSIIKSRFNVVSCTIQIETYCAALVKSCNHCQTV